MSAPIIRTFQSSDLSKVREIFFESSTRKRFEDEKVREAFYEKYLGYYLSHHLDLVKVVVLENEIMGYVVASEVSDLEELSIIQPHLKTFQEFFRDFPAHLHLNCHHQARGKGLGTLLVNSILDDLAVRNIRGLHIMTSPESKNRSFYQKLGFNFEIEKEFQGSVILFMGKSIQFDSL